MLSVVKRTFSRSGRPTRDDIVHAQYDDITAAIEYAASYEGTRPAARYYHSRMYVVDEALRGEGGDLLDVGCGPGMLVRHLLDTRSGDFRITACDRSAAMISVAADRAGSGIARLKQARIEDLPFPNESFDVVVGMGVLEYADAAKGLREVARVLRPDGLFVVSMLNPLSHYRLYQWGFYWPVLRLVGRVERMFGVPRSRRHGARSSGIRAIRKATLCRMMRAVGLVPADEVYYDLTVLVPPIDKIVRKRRTSWRAHPETTVSRGTRRWLGTGYLVTARRAADANRAVTDIAARRSGTHR